MKFNMLLSAMVLSIGAITAVPTLAIAREPSAQAENVRATHALEARMASLRARIAEGRRAGEVTRSRAARLDRQVERARASMTRLGRSQGFVSAAELATYDRTLNEVNAALDRGGVARGRGRGDGKVAAEPDRDGPAGLCRKETVAALVGHAVPDDAALKRLTGSQTIRRLAPGAMATRDYREGRLTVHLDDAAKVTAASCG